MIKKLLRKWAIMFLVKDSMSYLKDGINTNYYFYDDEISKDEYKISIKIVYEHE